MNQDIRWQQRFQNFERAFLLLQEGMSEEDWTFRSDLEKTGLTQRFVFTFELAWKTLRDYLVLGGVVFDQVTPRSVIKEAFAAQLIDDGQAWIDMLQQRNQLSHRYDTALLDDTLREVANRYLSTVEALYFRLREKRAT